jgi:tetratricopeptide (TPR) repeat protein
VIVLFPEDPSAYFTQGVIYDRMEKVEEALTSLRKAIELKPEYITARFQLIQTLEDQGRFDEAKTEYNAILAITKDEKTVERVNSRLQNLDQTAQLYALTKAAREYFDQGKFKESLSEADDLLAINPSNFVAYVIRGMSYVALKRPVDAIEAFKKALEIQPKSLHARSQLGQVYRDEGRFEEAIETFEQVAREGEGTRDGDYAALALKRLRPLSYSLSYSQTLDSNISQGSVSQKGVSSALNGGMAYVLLRNKQGGVSVRGAAQEGTYYRNQGTSFSLSGSLVGNYRLGERWILTGSLDPLNYNYFDQVKTSRTRGASWSLYGGSGPIPSRVTLRYAFVDVRSLRTRSGNIQRHTIAVSGDQQLTAKDSINVSYTFVSNMNLDKLGSNQAYRSNQVAATYGREIKKDVAAQVGLNMTLFNYANPDSTKLFREFRRTFQYGLFSGFSFPLSDRVRMGLNYSYVGSNTNLALSKQEQLELVDILTSPIPTVGGDYQRHALTLNFDVVF